MSRGKAAERHDSVTGFDVHLANFEGPFDLLLQLITRRELDITEVALAKVTDEFIAYVKVGGNIWDLEKTSAFLVVASTLLDLKAARLLPGGEVTDPDDIAALEARDLLFARLLQYRAFKQVSEWIAATMTAAGTTHWRPGGLEEQFRGVLPEVELPLTPGEVSALAAAAMVPRPEPTVELTHLHGGNVSLTDQLDRIVERLKRDGAATFRSLIDGCDRLTGVVRFLAVLELFRAGQVALDQLAPLSELTVRWTAGDEAAAVVVDDYGPQPPLEDA